MTTTNQRIKVLEHQITALEKRIAALELALKNGKGDLESAIRGWNLILLQFVKDFRISSPEIDKLVDELKQME